MTPPFSLDAMRRDDELLDLLAARRPCGDAQAGDPAVRLLAALAADVDTDLPAGTESLDDVAVEVLAAAFAAARASRGAPSPSGPVREMPRRRGQVVLVRRGVAALAGLAMVVTSAAVAAAVTGDPAGAFGLRAIASIVSGRHGEHPTASDPAVQRLRSAVADAARRSPLDPAQVARLQAEAQRLPDGGGPQLRSDLARLRAQLDAQTGDGASVPSGRLARSQPTHSEPTHSEPTHSQPTHSQPTHSETSRSEPSHSGQASRTSSGLASGRTTHEPTTPAVPTGQPSAQAPHKASGSGAGSGTGQPSGKGGVRTSSAPAGGGGTSFDAQAPR
jgi:hypothetical protein